MLTSLGLENTEDEETTVAAIRTHLAAQLKPKPRSRPWPSIVDMAFGVLPDSSAALHSGPV
jgi:hypothetical protein